LGQSPALASILVFAVVRKRFCFAKLNILIGNKMKLNLSRAGFAIVQAIFGATPSMNHNAEYIWIYLLGPYLGASLRA
jgi:hypothetical protein